MLEIRNRDALNTANLGRLVKPEDMIILRCAEGRSPRRQAERKERHKLVETL